MAANDTAMTLLFAGFTAVAIIVIIGHFHAKIGDIDAILMMLFLILLSVFFTDD